MVKTETDTKRKAEDEPTLVKVAGCPSMSVLGLTAATGWGAGWDANTYQTFTSPSERPPNTYHHVPNTYNPHPR